MAKKKSFSYKQAGVNIDEADRAVAAIRTMARKTFSPEVLTDIGSFGGSLRRIFSRFWKCFVARRGYREGAWGFLIALCAGLYPILSYLKARLETE